MGVEVQNVLTTGANRGIGFTLVKEILTKFKPEHVFATFRDPDKSKDLHDLAKKHKNVHLIQLDVCDHEKHAEVVKIVESVTKNAGLNLLINNAAILRKVRSDLGKLTYEDLKVSFDINTIAPLLLTQALTPLLEKASRASSHPAGIGKAVVVNMSSIVGSIGEKIASSFSGLYHYRCSKAALNAATKALSVDLKASGVIVIALHPGWVKTDMGGTGAPLTPEQSVHAILKLLEKLNGSNNGQFLQYDGRKLAW